MLTATSIFLKTLFEAGVTHAFCNWGSDHPAILEELERQRRSSARKTDIQIITAPNEMVALSAAQGYAQVTGRPAAVFVHVDVGTQALAGAVHNADRGRVPVFIYAGAAPFSHEGEIKGSKNEYIMWYQDVKDQSAIVQQYMRYTAEIYSWRNISQVVLRSLQLAKSEPRGPVYLWARREIMEEEIEEPALAVTNDLSKWPTLEPAGLSPSAVSKILAALQSAESPLIVTTYLGRNPRAVEKLVAFSEFLELPVFLAAPSVVSFPASHKNLVDIATYGPGANEWIRNADVILVIDSDVPWIPVHNRPRADARIFHIDVDVLKESINTYHINAELMCKADAETALTQLLDALPSIKNDNFSARVQLLKEQHEKRKNRLRATENDLPSDGSFRVPNLLASLRKLLPEKTLFLNESTSNLPLAWNHLGPDRPGAMVTSGSSSLGWGLGASIGAFMGIAEHNLTYDLVVLIVGDGSFVFGVPSAAFWMARKYKTPFLTIVLNNGGWKSPKLSMLGVYPNGLGSQVPGHQLTVGFGPDPPDYSKIAAAAGNAWGRRIEKASELDDTIAEAIQVVLNEKRCAVVDCLLEQI